MRISSLMILIVSMLLLYTPGAQSSRPLQQPPVAGSPDRVGVIAAVRGGVEITGSGLTGRIVESGEPVFLGDAIKTGDEGHLQVMLLDQTVFTVGPRSSLVIDEFVYNPETRDGKVDARVVKGLFRMITGEIGRKKPENLNIKLPVGSVGIRGTIILIDSRQADSMVMLYGPGENNNTGSRQGSFVLRGESGGADSGNTETRVDQTGYGAEITGDGTVSDAFRVPEERVQEMSQSLAPKTGQSAKKTGSSAGAGTPTGDAEDDEEDDGDDAVLSEEGINESDTEAASEETGQNMEGGLESLEAAGELADLGGDLADETIEAIQDAADEETGAILDGPTSWDNLQAEAAQNTGVFHYESGNVPLHTNGSSDGLYEFKLDIDFGSRTIGSSNSQIYISGNGVLGSNVTLQLESRPFQTGPGDAIYTESETLGPGVANCTSSGCDINATIRFENQGGSAAETAFHNVKITNPNLIPPNAESTGGGNDPIQQGALP